VTDYPTRGYYEPERPGRRCPFKPNEKCYFTDCNPDYCRREHQSMSKSSLSPGRWGTMQMRFDDLGDTDG
jgi:hypothetical protein